MVSLRSWLCRVGLWGGSRGRGRRVVGIVGSRLFLGRAWWCWDGIGFGLLALGLDIRFLDAYGTRLHGAGLDRGIGSVTGAFGRESAVIYFVGDRYGFGTLHRLMLIVFCSL